MSVPLLAIASLTVPGMALAGYSDVIAEDAPLAYYRFDQTDTTVLLNSGSLGTTANGTIEGSVDLGLSGAIDDPESFAASFSRAADPGRVLFDDSLGSTTPTSGTWEAWIRLSDLVGQRIVGFTSTWAGDGHWMLFVQSDGHLAFGLSDEETARVTAPVSSGEWTHVVCTWDGELLSLYIDGELVDSTAAEAMRIESADPVAISLDSTDLGFSGAIDEFAIYATALTADRIQAHYDAATSSDSGSTDGGASDSGSTDGGASDSGAAVPGADSGGHVDEDDSTDSDSRDKGCSMVPAYAHAGPMALVAVLLLSLVRRRRD